MELLQRVHEASIKIKADAGLDECPVFSQDAGGCPFKGAVCSDGVPLVDQLEYVGSGLGLGPGAGPGPEAEYGGREG